MRPGCLILTATILRSSIKASRRENIVHQGGATSCWLNTSRSRSSFTPYTEHLKQIYLDLLGGEHEKVGREPRPVGIGAHLEKNRRTRGLARGNPQQNAQAHQGSRPGRRRGVEVDGHSDLVARRHYLHWRILQEGREAYLRQGRVSQGPGPSLQLEPRRKRTPRDRHPRRRRSCQVRLQGARSPSGRPQQFRQVETFEEREDLRDSVPEQVRHRVPEAAWLHSTEIK